jgi:aldose sugar dehydrogenase
MINLIKSASQSPISFNGTLGGLAIAIATIICGCSSSSTSEPLSTPIAAPSLAPPIAKTFATGLSNPWGMTFIPDGQILVTEKAGTLRLVSADGTKVSQPILGVPLVDTSANSQGGLLDVEIDPNFEANRQVYLSFSEPGKGADLNKNGTAVVRAELNAQTTALNNVTVIFRQLPKAASQGHFGSRIVFANDQTLWITLGERQILSDQAQNISNHIGKVVRINSDGSTPSDNPYVNTAGAAKEVYTIGHRNIQGAAKHPVTGELWTNEHGPQGGDEINREVAGVNYGWPIISYGQYYNTTTQVGEGTSKPGLEQPVSFWEALDGSTPAAGSAKSSTAPSGLAFYTADKFPEWKGSLLMGALAGKSVWRMTLSGNTITARERLFTQLNERIRAVKQGPDGWIYLLTDNAAGRIIRIER